MGKVSWRLHTNLKDPQPRSTARAPCAKLGKRHIFMRNRLFGLRFAKSPARWAKQFSVGQEMGAAQETPDRAGQGTRLEGLLGVPEGHHTAVLSVRLARGPFRRLGAQASDYRGRCYNAAHTRASATRLYFLSEHRIRRCVSVPGTVSGM